MISDNALRRSVKIVARTLFILSCFNLLLVFIVALLFNSLRINFLDFINLFAASGLLHWRNGWRKYCIVIFWLTVIPLGIMLPVMPMVNLIPHELNAYKPVIWWICFIWVIYGIFSLIILHHPRVKAMFAPPKDQTATPQEPVAPGTPEPAAGSKDATNQK